MRIILKETHATAEDPSKILIYEKKKLVKEIIAYVSQEKGADYRFYPVVKFKVKKNESIKKDNKNNL